MKKDIIRKKRRFRSLHRGYIYYAALVAVGLFLIGFAVNDLLTVEQEYSAARSEYESLRELSPVLSILSRDLSKAETDPAPQDIREAGPVEVIPAADRTMDTGVRSAVEDTAEDTLEAAASSQGNLPGQGNSSNQGNSTSQGGSSSQENANTREMPASNSRAPGRTDPLVELIGMNQDFVGWIYIEGVLDYPIVRGADNDRYLNVTFGGNNNASGAIFMDSRNIRGFEDPVCVLFGHNMRDGSMFKPLHKYSSRAFMEEHPEIIVVTSDGEVLYYRIYAAKYEGSRDLLYELCLPDWSAKPSEFRDAPDGASHFLVLSTCTNSEDKEERLRVFAALEG